MMLWDGCERTRAAQHPGVPPRRARPGYAPLKLGQWGGRRPSAAGEHERNNQRGRKRPFHGPIATQETCQFADSLAQ